MSCKGAYRGGGTSKVAEQTYAMANGSSWLCICTRGGEEGKAWACMVGVVNTVRLEHTLKVGGLRSRDVMELPVRTHTWLDPAAGIASRLRLIRVAWHHVRCWV